MKLTVCQEFLFFFFCLFQLIFECFVWLFSPGNFLPYTSSKQIILVSLLVTSQPWLKPHYWSTQFTAVSSGSFQSNQTSESLQFFTFFLTKYEKEKNGKQFLLIFNIISASFRKHISYKGPGFNFFIFFLKFFQ